MATTKKAASAARARHARAMRKYTPEEVEKKWKALPPVERERFEGIIRRLVTGPPRRRHSS